MQSPIAKNTPPISAAKLNWSDLRIVLAVARAASIKGAAQHLNMTESTISRHISAAEASLNVHLFERTPTGMRMTAACEDLAEHLSRAEAELEAGLEAAANRHGTAAGILRMTTVPTLMNHVIIPAVPAFLRRYPRVELELIGLPADLSMMRREADLAVRLSRPTSDMGALTRSLGQLEYGVYAGARRKGSHAETLPWITYEKGMAGLPQAKWIAQRASRHGEAIGALRCNDADGLIAALRAGSGKTLLPRIVAANVPDLEELRGHDGLPSRELWLLVHPNLAITKRTRVAIDWLVALFARSAGPDPR
ncbi:LysR family transcriptional regulator [Breoghania sp. L-A4]|uniref:LysR family transcriptional regulator n=1 Tax=Breoghania sp. L-A4 TaxID=2304600 RepID=UPI0020BE5444|nr:LysR family transcriptional regulator [Breoghania sp. L-A4]